MLWFFVLVIALLCAVQSYVMNKLHDRVVKLERKHKEER